MPAPRRKPNACVACGGRGKSTKGGACVPCNGTGTKQRVPKVYNKKKPYPQNCIYVGRPTKFGNPFVIGQDGSREEVIEKFEQWVKSNPKLIKEIKDKLRGKDLVCFCAPLACHADVLLKIANE